MKSCVLIPARYASSRFPGKPLVELNGKPMIIRVCDIAADAVGKDNVFVATDDERIASAIDTFGYQYIMTSSNCLTGTDRIAEAAKYLEYEIIINVQGDEPIIDPQDIKECISLKEKFFDEVLCGYTALSSSEDPNDKNIPKVLVTNDERLIYMSRSPLPSFKDVSNQPNEYFKQVCIYGFSKKQLEMFASFKRKAKYEYFEDIEILRFFDLNQVIRMYKTKPGSLAIDTPEDVIKVEEALNALNQ